MNKYQVRGAGSVFTSIIHKLLLVNHLSEPWLGTVYKSEGDISPYIGMKFVRPDTKECQHLNIWIFR